MRHMQTPALDMDDLVPADDAHPRLAEALQRATRMLAGASDSPRLDAEVLLGHVLGLSRTALRVGADFLDDNSRGLFDALLERRMRGVPVAYLTGTREFWSLPLIVTSDVLVPRPDTEILVEQALALLPADRPRSVLDLGTGSGAIALALASERPQARIVGSDLSPGALDVARRNSRGLGLTHVEWRAGSWFDAVCGEQFDLIVSNPPYIAADDPALLKLREEPRQALSSGPTGLEALAWIAGRAGRYLRPMGWLILEHGSDQGDAVARLLEQHGFSSVSTHVDFAGNPRITFGSVHPSP
jgi:release factor glutamine methyltransferase